jgi:hypothetical protein
VIHVRTTDTKAMLALLMAAALVFSTALTCASQEVYASELPCADQECSDLWPTLKVLMSFPVHVTDRNEDKGERIHRLAQIAKAIDAASESTRDRAALLTLARFESNLARYVEQSRCSDGPRGPLECDSGRATGLWQIHGEVPADLAGQAALAIRIWRFGLTRCGGAAKDDFTGAFASYGSGGKCAPSGQSAKRAEYMRGVWGKL